MNLFKRAVQGKMSKSHRTGKIQNYEHMLWNNESKNKFHRTKNEAKYLF